MRSFRSAGIVFRQCDGPPGSVSSGLIFFSPPVRLLVASDGPPGNVSAGKLTLLTIAPFTLPITGWLGTARTGMLPASTAASIEIQIMKETDTFLTERSYGHDERQGRSECKRNERITGIRHLTNFRLVMRIASP